jgi:hypothetical protein
MLFGGTVMNNDMNTDYDDSQMCCGHSGVCSDCDMYDMTMPQEYDPCECFMPADLCPDLPLAEAYVRPQPYGRTFSPCDGLKHGTIFPDLVSQYKCK